MLRLRALAARLLVLAAGSLALLVLAFPAGSALATGTPACSTIASIPLGTNAAVTCTVASETDLASILEKVDSTYENYVATVNAGGSPLAPTTTTIQFTAGIQLTSDLPFVNGPVVIDGQGFASPASRAAASRNTAASCSTTRCGRTMTAATPRPARSASTHRSHMSPSRSRT